MNVNPVLLFIVQIEAKNTPKWSSNYISKPKEEEEDVKACAPYVTTPASPYLIETCLNRDGL